MRFNYKYLTKNNNIFNLYIVNLKLIKTVFTFNKIKFIIFN